MSAETKSRGCLGWVFRAALGLLWLVIGLLAAEMALRVWDGWSKTDNPFVLSRTDGKLWPKTEEAQSALVHEVPLADPTELPVPSAEDYAAAHAKYFAAMDPAFRETYGIAMDRLGALLQAGPDGGAPVVSAYAPESWLQTDQLNALLDRPRDGGIALRTAASAGTTSCQPLTQDEAPFTDACVAAAGQDGISVALLQRPISGAQPDTTWERPYMSYRPHASQAGQAQVYGNVPEFRLNNFGFRDDDVRLPKPEGTVRIVCIGASTTEEGPSNGFTYPNLLERFLNERFGAGKVEVINAGVSGTRTQSERARFPDYLMMEPDLIVFYNGVNDICHAILPGWTPVERTLGLFATRSKLLSLLLRQRRLPDDEGILAALRSEPGANIRAMAAYAKSQGVDTAVCSFAHPDWEQLDAEERVYYQVYSQLEWTGVFFTFNDYLHMLQLWNEEVKRFAAEDHLLYVPVAEHVRGGTEIFGDICHMRDRGIEEKARVVAASLESYVAAKLGTPQ
ncbi:MAG: hypothetical protein GC168_16435 [Candidatus Hydrogenedens sp.]|nr:hypothetical protein [Candidatus Hydrogenedens sp.]